MTDNDLMARLALGDTDALTELVQRNRAWAETLAENILRDHAQAEDVVQEAFARVYLLRADYQPTFAFRTYLSVLVRRLCIDQLRRDRRAEPMAELPEKLAESAENQYLRREERMTLWSLIGELDPTDRALLIGYALDGTPYRELARRHGMSLAQVKIRLHRIRKRLLKERDKE